MKQKAYSYLGIVFLLTILLSACGSTKNITYFQDIESFATIANQNDQANYNLRIMPNDNLLITVSANNPLAAEPYNMINMSNRSVTTNSLEWQGYLVDESGYINFPRLGKIRVAGLTKEELTVLLENKIARDIEGPVVNIRVLNYKVTVLGEVTRPGAYSITNEKVSIPEALAMAGDMTIYGVRDQVLLCRVENGQKVFQRINMKDPSIFNSPYYYLQQDDILYISPNKAQAGRSVYNQTWSTMISVTSLLFSAATLVMAIINK